MVAACGAPANGKSENPESAERSWDVVENKRAVSRRDGPAGRLRGDAPPERLYLGLAFRLWDPEVTG